MGGGDPKGRRGPRFVIGFRFGQFLGGCTRGEQFLGNLSQKFAAAAANFWADF